MPNLCSSVFLTSNSMIFGDIHVQNIWQSNYKLSKKHGNGTRFDQDFRRMCSFVLLVFMLFFLLFFLYFLYFEIFIIKITFSVKFCEFHFLPQFCEICLFSVSRNTGDSSVTQAKNIPIDEQSLAKGRIQSSATVSHSDKAVPKSHARTFSQNGAGHDYLVAVTGSVWRLLEGCHMAHTPYNSHIP